LKDRGDGRKRRRITNDRRKKKERERKSIEAGREEGEKVNLLQLDSFGQSLRVRACERKTLSLLAHLINMQSNSSSGKG
tara:strand:- start:520 stop:756 length:237 start_codon:yes stop_codon:yes gene_type:complete